jgi:hypothetical protein
MEVVVVLKGALEYLPPVMTAALCMRQMGNDVSVICGKTDASIKSAFREVGIHIEETQEVHASGETLLQKIKKWGTFRKGAWELIRKRRTSSLLWIGSADTALALGGSLLKERYVLQINELYDRFPLYRHGLRRFARGARQVVVPEACRAAIFRYWYGLSRTPFVLPNRPLSIAEPEGNDEGALREQAAALKAVAGRRLVLFQSQNINMNLLPVAEAVKALGGGHVLGLLGKIHNRDLYARLKDAHPEVIHFPYIVAPGHLRITRRAHIGVLLYEHESLNNIFCAPNKVWEYSGCGVPMICNELPMLGNQLRQYRAGETYEINHVRTIMDAIERIDGDVEAYRKGARALFDSVSMESLMGTILEACGDENRV